jgi:hypothetical protein
LSPKQQQLQNPHLQPQQSQPLSPKQQQQQQRRQQRPQRQPSQDIGKAASWPDHIDSLLRVASGMGCSESGNGSGSSSDHDACGAGLKVLLSSLTDDIYVTSEWAACVLTTL